MSQDTPKFKPGNSIRTAFPWLGYEGKIVAVHGDKAWVHLDNGTDTVLPLDRMVIIPDTVTIEVTRECAEYFGSSQWLSRYDEEMASASRKALGL